MGQRTITGSLELATAIRSRRHELNLTIEDAAAKAGVGTKSWSRYESGGSIRKDKYRGICKALNWNTFLSEDSNGAITVKECRRQKAWSTYLADNFGDAAAMSFAVGSELLLDALSEDMNALASLPAGTHVGQLGDSWLELLLPPQFLMRYDYDFLYALQATVNRLCHIAGAGTQLIAHNVLDELAIHLISELSHALVEASDLELDDNWDEWIYTLLGDNDLDICLYSRDYLGHDHQYHFDHWLENQFYR